MIAGTNKIIVGSQNGRNIDFLLGSLGFEGGSPLPYTASIRKVSAHEPFLETITETRTIQETGDDLTTTYVDLRSDTVTRPTPAMRRAMAEAEVGDDVFGEDPTVRLLEEETAALLGKEAALLVPSGCMGNEIAVAVHTRPGDSILLDRYSHIVQVEARAVTEMLGRRFLLRDGDRGRLRPEAVVEAAANGEPGAAPLGLVEVENTHN